MNVLNYFYYRAYKIYKKYNDMPSSRSVMFMVNNISFLLLFPMNMLIAVLFKGPNNIFVIIFIVITLMEQYFIKKYYTDNGRRIIEIYKDVNTFKYDKIFSMLMVCVFIPVVLFIFDILFLYFIFKMFLPLLNINIIGCLYSCIDFF